MRVSATTRPDPARLFAAAQSALAAGRPDDALKQLEQLAPFVAPSAEIEHLRAIASRRAGRIAEAERAFAAASRLAPGDAAIANNHANLLKQLGRNADALTLYDRALALRPGYRDALFNKALTLQKLDRPQEALALLEGLCAANPRDARAHSSRGAALRALDRHREAAAAFDQALALEPALPTALRGRAQVALERGEAQASRRFEQARAACGDDFPLIHGHAEALEAEGEPAAIDLIRSALAAQPEWVEGHQLLARMRAEAGDPNFADAFAQAAARFPSNRALRLALARTYAAGDKWEEAAAALDGFGEETGILVERAHYLSEAGHPVEAMALIESRSGAATSLAGRLALGRSALRAGDPERAARELERAVEAEPGSISAWSHLEVAWRLIGDARAEWLSGQPGLWSVRDIEYDEAALAEAAHALRAIHRTRAHPIGQSLRGGTQTRGRLFLREDPVIQRLHEALAAAVESHRAQLPPHDPLHPLLRHRDARLAIAGSWSVRLTDQGFHVHHIHPEGLLSSACYIALPAGLNAESDQAGWLELGRPPGELGLDLQPLAAIEPRPGRLALFPSYLFHGTRPFARGERLTVAFDVTAP